MKPERKKIIIRVFSKKDWTHDFDQTTGQHNRTQKFEDAVATVALRLRVAKKTYVSEDIIARGIVSDLVWLHGLAPIKERKKTSKHDDSEEMGLGGTSLR